MVMKRWLVLGVVVAAQTQGCSSASPPPLDPAASVDAVQAPAAAEGAEPVGESAEERAEPAEPAEAEPAEAEPAEAEPAEAEPQSGVPGANLTVGSITADGLVMKSMSCRAEGLGMLGAIVVAGTLSKKKPALSACAKGKAPKVRWRFTDNRITEVEVEGVEAPVAACVERALKGAPAAGAGECEATLEL
jgi:hypothetical protein